MSLKKIIFLFFLLNSTAVYSQRFLKKNDSAISAELEKMYSKGLTFLAKNQNTAGSWSGNHGNDPGCIGLAILAFLAYGDSIHHGPYSNHIKKSLKFILANQERSGSGFIGNNMYSHGFATLALAESYGMVSIKGLDRSLFKAVQHTLNSQKSNSKGAWRYHPQATDADTTITGCQIISLVAAQNSGIEIPKNSIDKALSFMASCKNKAGGYGYTSKSGGSKVTLTAIGSLCLALTKRHDQKELQVSIDFLQNKLDYRDSSYPFYFEYYMSQALFHSDFVLWQQWNKKNIAYLASIQKEDGSWDSPLGAPLSTATALLSLALNYRLLPIYER